jgi:hypothetical protein
LAPILQYADELAADQRLCNFILPYESDTYADKGGADTISTSSTMRCPFTAMLSRRNELNRTHARDSRRIDNACRRR